MTERAPTRTVPASVRSMVSLVVFGAITACGSADAGSLNGAGWTGGAAGSTGGIGGAGGATSGGAGGSGAAHSGGTGGRGSGGDGAASGAGGHEQGGGGTSGAGGEDAGFPGVCPGTSPPPPGYPTCRTSSDCSPSQFYICADEPAHGCGIGPPRPECYLDANCSGGQVCLPMPSPCGGLTNRCGPACTSTSCAVNELCATSGHCEPRLCTAGYSCGIGTVCGPAKAGADAHGCAPASCSTDGYACPTGFRCAAGASADAHGCTDVSCRDGFVCPANTDCNPASTAPHHCERRACTTDADCDCGACIGVCRDRLNVCSMLAP